MDLSGCFRRWRRWIVFSVVVFYIVVLVIALPLCIWELEKKNAANHVEAWFIGGIFVMMALPISFAGILQHIINYTQPELQRHIIRILWMVPVYAVNAWFALRFPSVAIYLDTLRECYEAYVIYNFMAYLLSFLYNEYPNLERQMERKPPVKHLFPLCCLPACRNGRAFIQRCKHGVLQYTVIRPTMTVIAVMCELFNKYGEGDLNFKSAWSYIVLINNASQILAMYCLVLFYKAFKEELQPLKPLPKFLCVKAVVFLSFWQGLVIAILVKLDIIPQNGTWVFYENIHEVSTGIQDFIICIEMFLAAIAHYYSFSHKPFVNLAAEQKNCCESFLSMWNVSDVTEDVVEHARYIGRGVHKRLNRDWTMGGERSPLLLDGGRGRYNGQNMQNRATPSPAVILEKEEARPFDFDNSSFEQTGSFANRSTTLSLNNYAEFSEFSTSVEVSRELKISPLAKPDPVGREEDNKMDAGSDHGQGESSDGTTAVQKILMSVDDKFEEIDAEEANGSDENEDVDLNDSHPHLSDEENQKEVSTQNEISADVEVIAEDANDGDENNDVSLHVSHPHLSDEENQERVSANDSEEEVSAGVVNEVENGLSDNRMQNSPDSDCNHNPVV